ncbi:GMC oxidoreductase, partial [Leptospira interrogans serovar Pomona]|nr:GMC oxidoreductase [Leptospira interrogans serovar Pomona]
MIDEEVEEEKKYPPGGFPGDVRKVKILLWGIPKKKTFLVLPDLIFFGGLETLPAPGLGGVSCFSANFHTRPVNKFFEN